MISAAMSKKRDGYTTNPGDRDFLSPVFVKMLTSSPVRKERILHGQSPAGKPLLPVHSSSFPLLPGKAFPGTSHFRCGSALGTA